MEGAGAALAATELARWISTSPVRWPALVWLHHRAAGETHTPSTMTLLRTGDLVKTPAERLAHEADERAEKRRQELAELRSDLNPPDVRIRMWEKLHQLRLPSDPAHSVLDVIAINTRLTLEQVREEQRARAARATNRNRV